MKKNHVITVESELEPELESKLESKLEPGVNAKPEGDETSALIRRCVNAVLDAEGVQIPCEVDVLLTDDVGIHEINLEQRQVDAPTDVLSFPMFELVPGAPLTVENAEPEPDTGLTPLGDMVISMERVKDQAIAYGHPERRELCYLVVHSVLHLLGYDHMDDGPQKARMRAREEAILAILGITRDA